MPTYNRERETEAAHALTHNQEVWSGQGWAVVTAGGLTAGSNALQLDVGSYEVLTGGTSTVSVGPTTIDAQLPDSDPYWLVVYVDGSGALQTAAGPEGAVAPGLGVDVREVSSPPPPTLAAVGPVTVLGRVLVTDDGIADPRIDDRVFGGDRVFDAIDANTVEAGEGYLTNAEQPLNSGIVEDFRSESFAHYDLASETGDMDFVTSPRINSDTPTLQHNPTTAASSGLASSLPYGGRGYVYSLITRFDATTGPETSLYAATTDTSNRIRFKFEARNNTAKIILLDGGTATSLASEGSLTVNANEWYTMLVTLGSEYIEYDIKNQSGGSILSSPLTATDNTQDGVGFGIELRNDGGESGYVAQLARRPL